MRILPLVLAALLSAAAPARADLPGTVKLSTPHSYKELIKRLDAAVEANGMGLVTRASATLGAASKGVTIPGNMVVGVFRPDFAVRMLEASVDAGIEAPLRFYLTENADGTATLRYRKPSAVFAPYEGGDALARMARELDEIFERIARAAAAP